MNKGKTKLTRQDAEHLFEGLPPARANVSKRPENPFEPVVPDVPTPVKRGENESTIWKDNLITLPIAIELPRGYESASQMREVMTRTLGVRWVREGQDEVVAEFPDGWGAARSGNGPIELRDDKGVVRAVFGWAKGAELRVLPRYIIESQSNSTNGLGSVLIRDRENGRILERSSNWSARGGTHHPDWSALAAWLDSHYPDHRDPLRYWQDCEKNHQP
jgi:hypothetical protein